jgi:nucleoside-diphosphate-sugar epimerase
VPRLVFTSSASVVYGGADQVNVDESTPYPPSWRFALPVVRHTALSLSTYFVFLLCSDTYSRTKAEAEKIVLNAAKDSGTLALPCCGCFLFLILLLVVVWGTGGRLSVVSVRPHGLYGPRDPMLLPTLTQTAKVCHPGLPCSRYPSLWLMALESGRKVEIRYRNRRVRCVLNV